MRNQIVRAAVVTGALVGAFLPVSGPAAAPADAAEPDRPAYVEADLDGDGALDPVTLHQVTPESMLLRVGLAEEPEEVTVPGNARDLAPRVVDLDSDGRDELLVPESVGANTIIFTPWGYAPGAGLRPTVDESGAPWRVAEGGGVSAISGYGCVADHDGRQAVLVDARLDDDAEDRYSGSRTVYTIEDGVATPTASTPVEAAPREDPLLQVDPATCAPPA